MAETSDFLSALRGEAKPSASPAAPDSDIPASPAITDTPESTGDPLADAIAGNRTTGHSDDPGSPVPAEPSTPTPASGSSASTPQEPPSARPAECDLLMRGGIASGIVYPKAIEILATDFELRSIGGTSAGAIAAGGAAAAAFGRRSTLNPNAFQELGALPNDLQVRTDGKKTQLLHFFTPTAAFAPLMALLLDYLAHSDRGLIWKLYRAVVRFPKPAALWFLLGSIPLIGSIIGLTWPRGEDGGFGQNWEALRSAFPLLPELFIGIIGLVLLGVALLIMVVGVGLALKTLVFDGLPKQGFGMCPGHSPVPSAPGTAPLADWLHDQFQSLSGKGHGTDGASTVLTVGDLRKGPSGQGPAWRGIELCLMTTDVTNGISRQFPNLEGSKGRLFFDVREMRTLFPDAVVNHMVSHGEQRGWSGTGVRPEHIYPLPEIDDLPVLLGVRMSLSFPVLLQAVPLYGFTNHGQPDKTGAVLRRLWFSDGGLTSNFPIHLFDGPLPGRPTFGINLAEATGDEEGDTDAAVNTGPGHSPRAGYVSMLKSTTDRIPRTRDNQVGNSLLGFGSALLDTARNWADTEQMRLPGYRDRVVHIWLHPAFGGLNLDMDESQIAAMSTLGQEAGQKLVAQFAAKDVASDRPNVEPGRTNWTNHQWTRYRTTMAVLESYQRRLTKTWFNRPGFNALLSGSHADTLPSYNWANAKQQEQAQAKTGETVSLFAEQDQDRVLENTIFDDFPGTTAGNAPRPNSQLRIMPDDQ